MIYGKIALGFNTSGSAPRRTALPNNSDQSPAVSVIIPCYKVTKYIADTLESLRAQNFRNFEAIVVNDGCPDTENLEKTLAPYRAEIEYIKQDNRGLAGARNSAIRRSRAPFVALLDADDIWAPDYLSVQLSILADSPHIDVLYPNATFFGDVPQDMLRKTYMDVFPSRGTADLRSILSKECYVFVGVTARRDSLLRAGLFDESLRTCEDFDMWVRLCRAGARFAYHTRPLVRYRKHAASLSAGKLAMAGDRLRVLRKLSDDPGLDAGERQALDISLQDAQAEADYYSGRAALYSRNYDEALRLLARANRYLRRPKLAAAILSLQYAPRLLEIYLRRYPTQDAFLR